MKKCQKYQKYARSCLENVSIISLLHSYDHYHQNMHVVKKLIFFIAILNLKADTIWLYSSPYNFQSHKDRLCCVLVLQV